MTTEEIIQKAVAAMREGGVILYPTDTIWGLGCDATNPEAVQRIFDIKQRPDSKSLVLLASDLDMVARYIKKIPNIAIDLVEVNDKPMTLIYPGAICGEKPAEGEKATMDKHLLAWNTVAEDGSVGIRIPMMDFCVALCRKLGRPIVSTSANISGEPSPKVFTDIPQEIVSAVDFVVPRYLEKGSTRLASQIIKVGLHDEVEVIRP
ncbi:MAG: threonylcarbamoyl-AMP synthase [Bacteroidales bacterium]|nr:threonylcarbamoyl-AMP synthase [Bacteroidales bacterium]